ncbi:MAG: hypothetical protein MR639_07395 [Clostridium sp.]|jgi:hypothetical protein|uniref:hypothetical protein n=1 Tax=Clostridium sp. TaxID=1506 RepID=UPI0032166F5C|nr:hypothetical protein [Clostridium sp.]
MNFDKIKELLKSRKVQAISALAICGIVVVGSTIFMINNKNTKESTKVDKIVKVENNKSKEEAKKEIEDLKKVDLSKLSEEEKKSIEENIKNIENMIENDKYSEAEKEVANIKKEVASKLNLEKNEEVKKEETTTSTDDKKEEASTNSSSSSKTTSSERASSSSRSSSGSSEASKPSEKPSETVKKHTHTWVDVTKEIVHAEEGHWEEVVITPEQVKEVPVYERVERSICNGCGKDITNKYKEHLETEMLKGNMACSGYHSEWREVQTGTKKEVIPAVTEKKWIVDKPAWTETKVVGRKCKDCGANE